MFLTGANEGEVLQNQQVNTVCLSTTVEVGERTYNCADALVLFCADGQSQVHNTLIQCAVVAASLRYHAQRGILNGSMRCTTGDTSLGTFNVSCTLMTSSPNKRLLSTDRS